MVRISYTKLTGDTLTKSDSFPCSCWMYSALRNSVFFSFHRISLKSFPCDLISLISNVYFCSYYDMRITVRMRCRLREKIVRWASSTMNSERLLKVTPQLRYTYFGGSGASSLFGLAMFSIYCSISFISASSSSMFPLRLLIWVMMRLRYCNLISDSAMDFTCYCFSESNSCSNYWR
jgi:hypothetical protein